jgi:hypothetical protein
MNEPKKIVITETYVKEGETVYCYRKIGRLKAVKIATMYPDLPYVKMHYSEP